jgi:hypothetical protein
MAVPKFDAKALPRSVHKLLNKQPLSIVVTVILADLDKDGRLDIVACAERGANELRWWRNAGK